MNILVEENSLQSIADAIRSQNGTNNTYTPAQMAQAVADLTISAGGDIVTKTVATEGTYVAEDDNADGYSEITNNIPWYIEPYAFDLSPNGYVMNNQWQVNGSTVNHSDVYRVKANHTYYLTLGNNVGTRFRGLITDIDPTPQDTTISQSQFVNKSNPTARYNVTVTSTIDGYLIITKDNAGKSGVKTYLFDITVA